MLGLKYPSASNESSDMIEPLYITLVDVFNIKIFLRKRYKINTVKKTFTILIQKDIIDKYLLMSIFVRLSSSLLSC